MEKPQLSSFWGSIFHPYIPWLHIPSSEALGRPREGLDLGSSVAFPVWEGVRASRKNCHTPRDSLETLSHSTGQPRNSYRWSATVLKELGFVTHMRKLSRCSPKCTHLFTAAIWTDPTSLCTSPAVSATCSPGPQGSSPPLSSLLHSLLSLPCTAIYCYRKLYSPFVVLNAPAASGQTSQPVRTHTCRGLLAWLINILR